MGDLKSKPVGNFVALGFVNFYKRVFLGLVRNRLSRADTRPIEDVQVIETSFRSQQLTSFHGSLRGQVRRFLDQRKPGTLLSQVNDLAHSYHLLLGNDVSDIHAVGIVRVAAHGCFHSRIEIAAVQISRRNAVPIFGKFPSGEWSTGFQFETLWSGQLIFRNAAVSSDLNVVHHRLSAFFDFECNVDR